MGAPGSQPGPGATGPAPDTARRPCQVRGPRGAAAAARGSRSARRSGAPRQGGATPDAPIAPYRGRPSRRAPRRPRRRRGGPARAPVRRLQGLVDLALDEKVDLFLVAGDLFDSNVQPRRSVERVAAELARLAKARIRSVIVPGTHDFYDRASIYRAYDLEAMAGSRPATTSSRSSRRTIRGSTSRRSTRRPRPVLRDEARPVQPAPRRRGGRDAAGAAWHIGVVHARLAIPDRTDRDEVVVTKEEIAASGLDYLALGHWHSTQIGKAGSTTYAYSGAPEPVAVDQDGAGKVLLVSLDEPPAAKASTVEERRSGGRRSSGSTSTPRARRPARARREAPGEGQPRPRPRRPPDRRPPRRARRRPGRGRGAAQGLVPPAPRPRLSQPALSEGAIPSADTITGAFIRDVEGRIAELEAPERRARREARSCATSSGWAGSCSPATRSACEDHEARVARLPPVPRVRGPARARAHDRPRPQRGRQDDDPAGPRARAHPKVTAGGRHGRLPPVGRARAAPVIAIAFTYEDDDGGDPRRARSRSRSRASGHGPARARRPGDHRPDARRPGARGADRHPDRGVLPIDRLDPPPRAGRPRPRRGDAPRPPPGVDQRRRPRHDRGRRSGSSGRSSS